MMSITRRLMIGMTVAAGVLAVGSSAVLFAYVRSAMLHQLDESLIAQAHALGSLVRVEQNGRYDLDFDHAVIPEYAANRREGVYEVRYADGRTFDRSPSLGKARIADRPAYGGGGAWNVTLPDGRAGRAMQTVVIPVVEENGPPVDRSRPFAPATVLVAQDRTPFDRVLDTLVIGLAAALTTFTVVFAIVLRSIVRHSLSPLYRLTHRASAVGPNTLHLRFDADELPTELTPIASRLNDLMERLETAFRRERRIGSDIAHELRTPIAELRSLADVACKWPPAQERVPGLMRDVRSVAVRMDRLVAALLTLARSDGASPITPLVPVSLAAIVQAWVRQAERDGLPPVQIQLPEACWVASDELLLGQLIHNLLDNAAAHADVGSPISVRATLRDGRWSLIIANDAAALTPADLPHLFEPFWRKEASRTNQRHSGLGLTLVSDYARRLGVQVIPSIPSTGRFQMCVSEMAACPGATTRSTVGTEAVASSAPVSHTV